MWSKKLKEVKNQGGDGTRRWIEPLEVRQLLSGVPTVAPMAGPQGGPPAVFANGFVFGGGPRMEFAAIAGAVAQAFAESVSTPFPSDGGFIPPAPGGRAAQAASSPNAASANSVTIAETIISIPASTALAPVQAPQASLVRDLESALPADSSGASETQASALAATNDASAGQIAPTIAPDATPLAPSVPDVPASAARAEDALAALSDRLVIVRPVIDGTSASDSTPVAVETAPAALSAPLTVAAAEAVQPATAADTGIAATVHNALDFLSSEAQKLAGAPAALNVAIAVADALVIGYIVSNRSRQKSAEFESLFNDAKLIAPEPEMR